MPQYQVPQFIDVEDKVFGPLTIKQFIYLLVGMVPLVIIYMFFKRWVLFVLGLPIFIFILALAFYKPNGLPFPKMVLSFVFYAFSNKLYLWKKKEAKGSTMPELDVLMQKQPEVEKNPAVPYVTPPQNKRRSTKLEDLAWNLDVNQEMPK